MSGFQPAIIEKFFGSFTSTVKVLLRRVAMMERNSSCIWCQRQFYFTRTNVATGIYSHICKAVMKFTQVFQTG
jgi:hypothetical protein